MDTFGEIVEPSSRATWEDWDDVGNNYQFAELHWHNAMEIPAAVDKFFLFEGQRLWDEVHQEVRKNFHEINSLKEVNLRLYKVPRVNNYICFVRDYDLMMSNDIVRLLQDLIAKSKLVTSVLAKPLSEYQTAENVEYSSVTRKITTTNTSHLVKVNYPKLEQPNFISGLSAGVFNLREHLGLSASLVVFYLEHSQVHEIEDIQTLLQKIDISHSGQTTQSPILNSNLYI